LRCDTGKVKDRCGGMSGFKGGLRCKGMGYDVNTAVITCGFSKYKYSVKTCTL